MGSSISAALTPRRMSASENELQDGVQSSCAHRPPEMSDDIRTELEIKLFHLTVKGDYGGVRNLIENGISVNATDYNGRSSLHLAAERGHSQIVDFLLEMGAKADCKDNLDETPLTLAMKGGFQSVQSSLIRAGAQKPLDKDPLKSKRSLHASFAVMEAFPHQIAAAMLEGRKIEPITKPMVSLLFSDIVGFTVMSSNMDAVKVSNMLNRLFKKFDRLAYLHGVQKVDVIGDAYIAATNFMKEQSGDHAARLARFAIDAMKAARETRIDEEDAELSGCIQLRIGMHCGPVSGSVVGSQGLKYTLMGDTVNVASRMESTCGTCKIQCSEASAQLIAAQASEIVLKRREGGVEVKGKGRMETYWVSSLRQGLRTHSTCPDLLALARLESLHAPPSLGPSPDLHDAPPSPPPGGHSHNAVGVEAGPAAVRVRLVGAEAVAPGAEGAGAGGRAGFGRTGSDGVGRDGWGVCGGLGRTGSDGMRRSKSVVLVGEAEQEQLLRLHSDGWLSMRSLNRL